MEVVSHCSLPVAGRVWKPRPGAFLLTFVCKATFALAPGKLALAGEQQPVHERDRPWSNTVTSLYAAADLVPRKLRPDVVLIGNAYAPRGAPVEKLVARLAIAEVNKAVEVWCDRMLQADGSVARGPFFTQLPLLYERAAGGPGTDNPAGMAPGRDAQGAVALPNLMLPGARVDRDAPIKPACFGPVAARWPGRAARLGRHGEEVSAEAWSDKPLPADLDLAYFNVAPPDQQLSALRGDERLVLTNLNREHAELTMMLPGLQPRAKVTGPSGEKSVAMTCDMLWIDTTRELCCLTYRGHVPLSTAAEVGWVVVTLDSAAPDEPSPRGPIGRELQIGESTAVGYTLPFVPPEVPASAGGREPRNAYALPFQSAGDSSPFSPGSSGVGLPFRREASSSPVAMGAPAKPTPATAAPAAPALIASLGPESPWAVPAGTPVPATIYPVTVGSAAASPPVPGDFRGEGGALLASNAAAGVAEVSSSAPRAAARVLIAPAAAPRSSRSAEPDALDLVFFDIESLPRIRRVAPWKRLLAELEGRGSDAEEDDPSAAIDPAAIEDRREIIEILVVAEPSDAAAVDEALGRAVREDGRFFAPILLLAGELSTPFDEIETLRATVTTVTPLAGNDENLRASLEIAKDFLKLPGLSSSPAVAEGLTARVRDAFNQGKRAVQPGYVDAQTERALVEQRFYQHRTVLGARRQRALFHFDGGSS